MNKDIDKLMNDSDFRAAIEGALEDLGRMSRRDTRNIASMMVPSRAAQFIKAIEVLKESIKDRGIVREEIDALTRSGTIEVCAESLNFVNPEPVIKVLNSASNFNVYINPDGKIQMDLVFYEMMYRV